MSAFRRASLAATIANVSTARIKRDAKRGGAYWSITLRSHSRTKRLRCYNNKASRRPHSYIRQGLSLTKMRVATSCISRMEAGEANTISMSMDLSTKINSWLKWNQSISCAIKRSALIFLGSTSTSSFARCLNQLTRPSLRTQLWRKRASPTSNLNLIIALESLVFALNWSSKAARNQN